MKKFDITVVVPTLQFDFDYKQLGFSSAAQMKIQIVVVSQGVNHPSKYEFPEWGQVSFHYVGRRGVSFARNLGIQLADADVIVFLDDDVISNDCYLKFVSKMFSDQDLALLICRVSYNSEFCMTFRFHSATPKSILSATGSGSGLAIRKSLLNKRGIHFDERIGPGTAVVCGEDTILCISVWKSGMKVLKTNWPACLHPSSGSTIHRRDLDFFNSYLYIIRKYYGLIGFFLVAKFWLRLLLKEVDFASATLLLNCFYRSLVSAKDKNFGF
ncbi:MAG: glycosyltransferase [Candidatus Ozemobacteraceae bacterium]